ncbi:MAG: hypothetical protein ACRYFX_07080 [Janthinobacterium lividum]
MDLIEFSIGCRSCRETDGKRWQFEVEDEDEQGQSLFAGRSDFGVMRVMEMMTLDLGHVCPFCSSPQLEIFDMAVNGQLLFDFDALCRRAVPQGLAVCALTTGEGNGQPFIKMMVEPPDAAQEFLLLALDEMAVRVQERPDYDFVAEQGGIFYFCVAGRWATEEVQRWMAGQKYTCRGYSREQALAVIESVRTNLKAGIYSAEYE